MATDDQVFRITFVFDGGTQFRRQLTEAQAAAEGFLENVDKGFVRFGNNAAYSITKVVTAQQALAQAMAASGNNVVQSLDKIVSVFGQSTERISTGSNRTRQALNSLVRQLDPLTAGVEKAQKAFDRLDEEYKRLENDTEGQKRIVGALANAYKDLQEAQAKASSAANDNAKANSVVLERYTESLSAIDRYTRSGLDQLIAKYQSASTLAKALGADIDDLNAKFIEGAVAEIRAPTIPGQATDFAGASRPEFQQSSRAFADPADIVGGRASSITGPTANQVRAASLTPTDLVSGLQESQAQEIKNRQEEINKAVGVGIQLTKEETNAIKEQFASRGKQIELARQYKDRLDPLVTILRPYRAAQIEIEALAKQGNLTDKERIATLDLLKSRYNEQKDSLYNLSKGQTAYNELVQASNRLVAARGTTTATPPPQLAQNTAVGASLQRDIAAQKPIDPAVITSINNATKATIELAAAQENANKSAQSLRDSIDPIGAAQRAANEEIAKADVLYRNQDITRSEFSDKSTQINEGLRTQVDSLRNVSRAQSVYNDLIQNANRLRAAQGTTATASPQLAQAAAVGTGLQTRIASQQIVSPADITQASDLAGNLKELAIAEEQANKAAQDLTDKLNPVAAIQRAVNTEIDKAIDLYNVNKLSAEALAGTIDRLAAAEQKEIDNITGVTKARLAESEANKASQKSYDDLTRTGQLYIEKLNPLISIQRQYRERIAEINAAVLANGTVTKQTSADLAELTTKEIAATKALEQSVAADLSRSEIVKQNRTLINQAGKDFVDVGSTITRVFGLNRIGFLQLQAAGVNAFQALASGIAPLRVAETEGAQVIGALIQGVTGGFRAVLAYAAPIAAIVAPLLAVAGVLAAVVARIVGVNTNLREFQIQLDTVGKGSNATAKGLQDIVDNLRNVGFSADDAKKSVEGLLKLGPSGLVTSGENIAKISQVGLNISAQTGANPAEEAVALGKALAQGRDALIQYADERGLFVQQSAKIGESLSAEVIAQNKAKETLLNLIITQSQFGKTNENAITVLNALSDLFAGKFRQSQSGAAQSIDDIGARWRSLLKTLSDSSAIQAAVNGISSVIKGLLSGISGFITIIDGAIKGIGNLFREINTGIDNLLAKLPSLPDWLKGGAKPAVPNLPYGGGTTTVTPNIYGGNTGAPQITPNIYGGATPSPAGMSRVTTISANVVFDTPDLQRIAAVLGEASKTLPEGYSIRVQNTERPGATVRDSGRPSEHGIGKALDYEMLDEQGRRVPGYMSKDVTGKYSAFDKQVLEANQRLFPGTPLVSGALSFNDAGHIGTQLAGTPGYGVKSATAADAPLIAARTAEQTKFIRDLTKAQEDNYKGLLPLGVAQRVVQAGIEAENQAAAKGIDITKDTTARDSARTAALKLINLEVQHELELQDKTTAGAARTVTAFKESDSAGIRSLAVEQARITAITQGGDAQQRANSELQKGAIAAVLSSQQQITATGPVLARQQALAEAAGKGAAAEHEQTLQNQASTQTYDGLIKATAAYEQAQLTGTAADVARTKTLRDVAQQQKDLALEQIRAIDAAQTKQQLRDQGITNQNQIQIEQLEVSLQGQTTEEISRQVSLLQAKQFLLSKNIDITKNLTDEEKKIALEYLNSVNALGLMNTKLAEAQLLQQRLVQLFQNIGETISSTLGTAIEDAFSGTKITDWGARLKQIIAQTMQQIVQFAFIRPAIGSVLQAFGQQQAAQSFGSFGPLTASAATTTGTATSGGAINLGTIGQVAGLAKDVAGSSSSSSSSSGSTGTGSIFGEGGFSSFLNNIGGKIGFAQPLSSGSFAGLTAAQQADLGIPTVAPGSLFGSTTLGSALGGIGIGVGGGGLVSSLLGGNPKIGSAAGGVLGLGGSILAPLLGIAGPFGAIAGGLLGGLTGLLGNNKPSNFASGGLIDVATGRVSGVSSSGNAQNDQTVNQITTSIAAFTKSIQSLTGGTATGAVNVQAGTREGIQISTSGSLGQATTKAADAATAINDIELKIAQNLSGVSETLRVVLAHTTDPAQIQANVQFAATYDDLKKASDTAFSSISTDIKTVGPFAAALDSLNTTFKDLTDKATEFGLSLDPINAGLAEATKRLQQDFGKALDQAINSANGTDFVNQIKAVSEAFASNTREAQAIGLGGDTGVAAKIAQLEVQQATQILSPLTTAQRQQVVDALRETNPEISAMAQALIDVGAAAQDATDAIKAFATGIKALEDTALALKTGPLAGLTPAAQVAQSQNAFNEQLGVVTAAGRNATGEQLTQLSTLGTAAVQKAQDVFGNAPQTADLRHIVLAALDRVTAVTGSSALAAGSTVSPVQATIQGSASVTQAQSDAVTAALRAAGVAGFAEGTKGWQNIIGGNTTSHSNTSHHNIMGFSSGTNVSNITTINNDNRRESTVAMYANGTPGFESYRRTFVDNPGLERFRVSTIANDNSRNFGNVSSVVNRNIIEPTLDRTPPGPILVGEKGSEWYLPKGGRWHEVGLHGPEVLMQPGGGIILPHGTTPSMSNMYQMGGNSVSTHRETIRGFADGTSNWQSLSREMDMPAVTFDAIRPNVSNTSSGDAVKVVEELKDLKGALQKELVALVRQTKGGQEQAMNDAAMMGRILQEVNRKAGIGLDEPRRQKLA